jgi:hypothetical protein
MTNVRDLKAALRQGRYVCELRPNDSFRPRVVDVKTDRGTLKAQHLSDGRWYPVQGELYVYSVSGL